jgi:hypothetical protein
LLRWKDHPWPGECMHAACVEARGAWSHTGWLSLGGGWLSLGVGGWLSLGGGGGSHWVVVVALTGWWWVALTGWWWWVQVCVGVEGVAVMDAVAGGAMEAEEEERG